MTLLGVVDPFGAGSSQPPIGSFGPSGERRDARLMRYLKGVAMFLKLRGVEAEPTLESGPVPGKIVAEARELGCDLIAILVHKNAVLGRRLLGNSADPDLGQSDPSLILLFPQGTRDRWETGTPMVLRPRGSAALGI